MEEHTRIIVRLRLEKCREDLKFARLLIEQGAYRIGISRAYYAVFMAATAALLTLGITRRKHSGVHSAFNQYLVKPGFIEPEYGKIYKDALKARLDADYSDFAKFTKEQAESILSDAERFVERVGQYLVQIRAL